MPSITAPGIGSGLDVNSIVSQLMSLEQQPIVNLQQKEVGYATKLSAIGQLRSAVSPLQDAANKLKDFSKLAAFTAKSADSAKFTASSDNTAAAGSFDIQVQALAQSQKLGSASQPDKDTTTFGNTGDTLSLTVNGNSFSVASGGKTLSEIASAINAAGDNVGVSASVVQENASSFYLVLTSDNTGTANTITTAFKDSNGSAVADPLNLVQVQAADDARILIDNTYTVTRSSNTLDDAIEGVTLNLKETSTSAVNLTISRQSSAIKSAVQDLVDGYNSFIATSSSLSAGELSGDSTVRSLQRQVRSVFNTPPSGLSGSVSSLTELGVSFQKDGSLTLDSSKLESAINDDLAGVTELFADTDQGYGSRLASTISSALGTGGLISAREEGLNTRINDAEKQIASIQLRLDKTEQRLRNQFSALDSLMSRLTQTSSFLTAQLSSLSNLTSGNSGG